MNILFLLIPLSLMLLLAIIAAFVWAVRSGQFEDLDTPPLDVLRETPPEKVAEVFAKEEIEGIRAIDDTTLELKLVKPYPQILHVLTMTFVAPVAPEVVAKYGDARVADVIAALQAERALQKAAEKGRRA